MDPDDEDVELYSADIDTLDRMLGVAPATSGGHGVLEPPSQYSLHSVSPSLICHSFHPFTGVAWSTSSSRRIAVGYAAGATVVSNLFMLLALLLALVMTIVVVAVDVCSWRWWC
jgi:homoserine kinase